MVIASVPPVIIASGPMHILQTPSAVKIRSDDSFLRTCEWISPKLNSDTRSCCFRQLTWFANLSGRCGGSKMRGGGNRSEISDTAINAAWTAWHLVDWLWRHWKAKACRAFSLGGSDGKRSFFAAVRSAYPHLAVCDVIANASKHGGVAEQKDGRPDVETILLGYYQTSGDTSLKQKVLAIMKSRAGMVIVSNGQRQQAPQFFRATVIEAEALLARVFSAGE